MSDRLDGRTVLVVGAGSQPSPEPDAPLGNGRAIAVALAAGARAHARIEIREHTIVRDLLLGERSSGSGAGQAAANWRM